MAKRLNFKDVNTDNSMDVEFLGDSFSFYSQDDDSDELVEVVISKENAERLIKHLTFNLQRESKST